MSSSDLPAVPHPTSPLGEDVEKELEEEEDEEEEEEDTEDPSSSWTVSTYKPGCGVAALLNPQTSQFWQSDGPQPHLLNVHFFKRVAIVRLRMFLDIDSDESYTPTRMLFLAGHSEYDLVEFAEWRAPSALSDGPKGWVDVSLESCWTGSSEEEAEEYVLRCMFLQIRVLENNQNGKDTHIRGIQIWARDEREGRAIRKAPAAEKGLPTRLGRSKGPLGLSDEPWLEIDMAECQIR